MNSSIKIVDRFLNFEKDQNLFFIKNNDGLYYWDYIRYDIFYHILVEKNIFQANATRFRNKSFFQKFLRLFEIIFNQLAFFFFATERPVLFFTVSRNIDKDGKHFDSGLIDLMMNTDSYFCIESFIQANFSFKDRIFNKVFIQTFKKSDLNSLSQEKAQYLWLSDLINQTFETEKDWAQHIAIKLQEIEFQRTYFRKVLSLIKPRVIFFSRNGNIQSLVSEGHRLGIKVFEMQHGSITPASLFYNYPNDCSIDHLKTIPDGLLTFGSYWNNKVSNKINTITIGNNQTAVSKEEGMGKEKIITVVSGKYVFKRLLEATCKLAKILPEYRFYFKLHPGEKDHIKPAIKETQHLNNVEVVYNKRNVETLLKCSRAVILVQSTSSYLALQLGLQIFIIKSHYYDESSDIFEFSNVFLVDFEHEIADKLQMKINNNLTIPEFFSSFKNDVFNKLIDEILN